MPDNTQIAINAALSRDWELAVKANKAILEENDKDIDALSRLAYGLQQLEKIDKARKIYRKILSLDSFNSLAQKNLERINSFQKNEKKAPRAKGGKAESPLSPHLFLEESGKTKTIILTNVAPANILSKVHIGDEVLLHPKKYSIEIRSKNKTYLGALPDDIAFRLIRFLKAGNQYYVCVKNVKKNGLSVFLRETKRCKRFQNQPTFLPINFKTKRYKKKKVAKDKSKHCKKLKKNLKNNE